MKRKIYFSVLLIVTILLMATACKPSGSQLPPWLITPPSQNPDSADFVKGFSTEQIIRDIAGKNSDITVEYKVLSDEQTQAIRTFASATPMPLANESSVKIEAIATFTGYNLNGRILYGSMVFTFSATTTDNSKYEVTDYTAGSTDSDGQSHSLRISIGTYTESVTLENLSGTIEASAEISTGSSEASITITSITEDAYNGSFNVGGENVPAAVASGEFDEGEDGTEANPYSLDNLDDLKKLSNFSASDDSKIYAELTGSITISMSDYIDAFSNIVLDGNGYSITTIGTSDNSNAVYYVFEGVTNSTIRNLTYNINSEKPLIQQTRGDVILDGIILNGHVDITGNNTSGFVSYAYPITGSGTNSTLTFNNCVNNADFIDSMGSYGAPFVAIVLASDGNAEGVNLEFNNCENNGDIFYANGAGLLVGNMYRADNDTDNRPETWFYPSTITVNNFTNAGSVNSFKRAEFINGMSNSAHDKQISWGVSEGDYSGGDLIWTIQSEGISISETSENMISFTIDNKDAVAEISLIGYVYVGYFSGSEKIGNYASYSIELIDPISISSADLSTSIPVTEVCGPEYAEGQNPVNGIVTVNGKNYWLIDIPGYEVRLGSDTGSSDPVSFSKYCAVARDAEGRIITMADVTSTMTSIISNN